MSRESLLIRAKLFKSAVEAILPPKGDFEDFHIKPMSELEPFKQPSTEKERYEGQKGIGLLQEISLCSKTHKQPSSEAIVYIQDKINDGAYDLIDLYSKINYDGKAIFLDRFFKKNPSVFHKLKFEIRERVNRIKEKLEEDTVIINELEPSTRAFSKP
jgi:hypothetical protein